MPGSQIVGVTGKRKARENMSPWSGKRFLPFYFVFALSQFSLPRLSRSGEVCSLACQVRVSCITCITSVAAVVSFPQRPLCVGVAGRLPRDEAWGHYHGDLDELSGFLVMTWDPVRVFSMKWKPRFHPGQFLIWGYFVEKATIWWKTCDQERRKRRP